MSDLLSIGTAGLRSYRAALNVTGDNVANAQTEGYARRSVRIAEAGIGGGPTPLYRNQLRAEGSVPAGITRAADAFRTLEARAAGADASRTDATARWLATTEAAAGGDVAPALTTVFANGQRLAADPTSAATRAAFLGGVADAASAIATSADSLARVASTIAEATASTVDTTNADLTALASINVSIRRQPSGTAAFAQLEDQRDALLDKVTAATGATASVAGDGVATIRIGAAMLLDGKGTAPLVPGTRFGGTLGGLASAAATVGTRREELDTLATSFAATVNDWQARGLDAKGQAGVGLLAMSGDASTTVVTTDDPGTVAAASSSSANGNALALSGLRTTSGLEDRAAQAVSRQASATAKARDAATISGARRDAAAAARDGVEGVDLDREAADLLRYQQAYQGAARVIQAARETVDTILALFR